MKARKLLALLLTCVLVFQCIPIYAQADSATSGTCGDNVTWNFDTQTGTLTIRGTGRMYDFSPYPLSPWGNDFQSIITSVKIESGVTSIGKFAFYQCTNLTSVSIPNSVTSIGYDAFYGCSSLASVTIPDSVTFIGKDVFHYCSSLVSVNIPDSVTSIGEYAFASCSSLARVAIPDSVTSIGRYAFSHCTNLTSVTIPDSVTFLGDYAFSGCSSLSSVTIPNSVTSIGNFAFSGCSSLTSVTIPNSVTSIGTSVFDACSSLTSVTIPDSVISIGHMAFCACSSLTSVTIPDSVTSIGTYAFSHCTNLTSVTIPDSVTFLGDYAFYGCTSLTSVTVPNSVTSIGRSAFGFCDSLTSVTVPNSVTSIGKDAFVNCSGLTSVHITDIAAWCQINFENNYANPLYFARSIYLNNGHITDLVIPNGVTSIGNYAFNGCNRLTSVSIPDGVASVGNYAFSGCNRLTSVNIPDGMTSIGHYAFSYCSSLTSLTIPDSVTSIGYNAFSHCSSLTSVNIPSSVTSIGEFTFYGCSSLTSITIPERVSSISRDTFYDCSKLTDVYFMGSAPSVRSASDAYPSFPQSVTLHYSPGSSGWTDSSAYDVTAGTWNGYTLKKWDNMLPAASQIDVPTGQYCIHVVDENGTPISGAIVGWEDSVELLANTTDKNGNVFFPLFTIGNLVIDVEKAEYIPWTNKDSNWQKSDKRYDTVVLYSEGLGEYKLHSARYSNFSSMNPSIDVLTETKKLSLGNDLPLAGDLDFGKFYLSCKANNPDKVVRYELWQDKTKIAESGDGFFSKLSTDSFSEDGTCFVRVVSSDNNAVDTAINLVFVETAINKETISVDISAESISFSIGDNVPFVGGSTFSMSLPLRLPVTASFGTDNKVKFGFNLNLAGAEDDEEVFKKAKELVSDARKAGKTGLTQSQKKAFKALAKDKFDFTMFDDAEFNLIGYAEADLGSSIATGHIMFETKLDIASMEYNTVVVVVPVTIQVGLSAGADATAEISYDWANAALLGTLDLGVNGKLTAFGGVGVSKLVGVGAYGSAELEARTRLLGTPKGLQSVDLTGELGLKAYFAGFEYERPFAYNTWHLYTATALQSWSIQKSFNAGLPGVYDASQYQTSDLSYLSRESKWQGETNTSLFRTRTLASADSVQSTQFNTLLENTYRNAQPVMTCSDDSLYAVFLRADAESGDIYLSATKFDGTEWTEPVRVDKTAVLDGSPSLCIAEDGTILLAYTRTNETYDRTSLMGFAESQSVVVGCIDADTLQFTKLAEYEAEGYAHKACLSNVDGLVTLAWLDSTVTDDNSVLFPAHSNICCTEYADGEFGQKSIIASVDKPVLSITVGDTVAYVADEDGDYGTTGDHSLYCVTNGLLAEQIFGKVTYGRLPGDSAAGFIWNDEAGLNSTASMSIPVDGITNEYTVLNNTIYYSASGDSDANLMMLKYNDGNWTSPIQLTDEDRYFENINVLHLSGCDYVLGMHTAAAISENKVTDAKNLVWAKISSVNDIALIDVTYDEDALAVGEDVELTLHVANTGESTVTSIDVSVDGSLFGVEECELLPGEIIEIVATVLCTDNLESHEISVCETGKSDYTPEDNTYNVGIGYADVAVDTAYQQIGSQQRLMVYVTNEGIAPASGYLRIYVDGKIIGSGEYKDVKSDATAVLLFDLADGFMQFGDCDVTVVADSNAEELYSYNNSTVIHIVETLIDAEVYSASLDGTTVSAEVGCAKDTIATAFCACYNADRKMIEIKEQQLTSGMNEIDFVFTKSDGAYYKLMIVNAEYSPLAEAITLYSG